MNVLKILGVAIIIAVVMVFASEIGQWLSIPGAPQFVPTAQAIVGRPLTPVSVAGVARRSVRRCAVGVYNCSIPGSPFANGLLGQASAEPIRFDDHQTAAADGEGHDLI